MSELLEYKCPACGGAINFDSASQQMKCPYCEASFDVEALKSYDDELKKDQPSKINWNMQTSDDWGGEDQNMGVYICQSCGGEIFGDETVAATSCPFCDNPIVMTSQLAGVLRPDLIIPFKLDKKAAKEALTKHLSGKPLLPKVFKDQNHIDEIKGVYVPFWLFDADVDANIHYKATRLRAWSDSNYNYTETSFYHIWRAGNISFAQVPVDGSSKMPDDLTESVEPFDFSEAVDFQTAYLAGYLADKYDVDSDASIDRANQRVKTSTEKAFEKTVMGYSSVIAEHSSVNTTDGKARYALLPIWVLNTTWNGEKYLFAMNGQTGKFVGNLPLDKGAYWRWFGAIAAGVSALAFGIQILYTLM